MLKQTANYLNRLHEINIYNPKKGNLNENFGKVDTTGWICVGEIPGYYPWIDFSEENNKVYIMVNPQKTMMYGNEINEVIYTQNSDGSGRQTDRVPTYNKQDLVIYPEYRDTEYGEMFLGKKKDNKVLKEKHAEFVSKLFKYNGKIILHHNSSVQIKDGYIKKGKTNRYSNNSDIGIYFWGSRNSGKDPSGNGLYTYYCMIDENDLYDFETNAERLTLTQALHKYAYAGQYWRGGDAICVNTYSWTPIWCILDKMTGKWYDSEWKPIEKPF